MSRRSTTPSSSRPSARARSRSTSGSSTTNSPVSRRPSDDGLYAARSIAGQQLLQNPSVGVPAEEQDLLTSGVVDGRILLTLGQLAAIGRIDIADIAQLDGDPSGVHRQLVISAFAGEDARGDAAGFRRGPALLRIPHGPARAPLHGAQRRGSGHHFLSRRTCEPPAPTRGVTRRPGLVPPASPPEERITMIPNASTPDSTRPTRRRRIRGLALVAAAVLPVALGVAIAPAAPPPPPSPEDGRASPTSRPTPSRSTCR